MELLFILLVIISLIALIVFQIKRAIRWKKEGRYNKPAIVPKLAGAPINPKVNYGSKLQFLETINIIDNTASLDTLEGRLVFALETLGNIVEDASKARYVTDCQKALDEYKTSYYDKVLKDYEIALLLRPNVEDFKAFVSNAIFKCYKKYVEKQEVELAKLKQEAAKERRKEDLIKKGYSAKYLYKTYSLPDNGNIEAIEDIRKRYYSHQNNQ